MNDKYVYERENRLWTFMTTEQELQYYFDTLDRVIANPRWYLDHLDELTTFRVSFIHYYAEGSKRKRSITKHL